MVTQLRKKGGKMKKNLIDLEGLRVRASAYNKDITPKYVASALGITTKTLTSKENGAKLWDTEIMKLMKLYDVSFDELEMAIVNSRK